MTNLLNSNRSLSLLFLFLFLTKETVLGQTPGPDAPWGQGSPLPYNVHRAPLTGGYNSHAAPADFDGDGDIDLAIHSSLGGGAHNTFWGIHLYENISPPSSSQNLFFLPPRKILNLDKSVIAYDWDGDGMPDLIAGGRWYRNRGHLDFADGIAISNFPDNVKAVADWNGDSIPDLFASERLPGEFWPPASVWRNGESPYTPDGIWKGGPLRGSLRYYRGTLENGVLHWIDEGVLQAGGEPLEVYGDAYPALADWDGDNDLDLLVGGLFDLTYYENTGNHALPSLAPRRRVFGGENLPGIYIRPAAVFLDRDPFPDLIVAQESGELLFFNTMGITIHRTPYFTSRQIAYQQNALLDAGCLSVISAADWDNDGDLDIVSGNSYGEVILFLQGGKSGKWQRQTVPTIHVQAGANGSIQGPNEAHFGYTCPVFCDWNRDGQLDLIVSDIWGKYTYYPRVSVPHTSDGGYYPVGFPILCKSPRKDLFVPPWVWHQPKHHELITQWRCQPGVEDWNRDGLLDLITLDSQGYLALYPGVQIDPPEVDAPQRCFLLPDGNPIRVTNGLNGRAGRARIAIVDWDGDGDRDILRGCTHAGDHEDPHFADYERVAVWYENTGDDRTFSFRGNVLKNNRGDSFCGHATSPAAVDWDRNGTLDLLLGTEDGLIYFFTREYLERVEAH